MLRRNNWVLTVLVLLFGLLGMHALSSDHHSMTGMAGDESISISTGASASAAVSDAVSAVSGADYPSGVLAAPAAFAVSVVLTVSDATTVLAHPLCVAVLTATVLLLLVGLSRRSERPSVPQSGGLSRGGAAALWRPGPPDPVAELCVSRT